MGDSTAAGSGAGAGRRPWSPGPSFRLVRVEHEAVGQIALPMLSTVSLVPQFYMMLQQDQKREFTTPLSRFERYLGVAEARKRCPSPWE